MLKHIFLLVGFLLTPLCSAQIASTPASRDGIWVTSTGPTTYFSLHEKNGTLVMIYLGGIARESDPLKSTYVGPIKQEGVVGVVDQFKLTGLTPAVPPYSSNIAQIQFLSATEAVVALPVCDICLGAALRLNKVF